MATGLNGKVVVITGASSGLGEAAARHLAEQGALLVLGARRADRIQALADELRAAGHQALSIATDVTDSEQVKKLVDTAVEAHGRVDVLVNNAGVAPLSLLEKLKIGEWDQMIDVNLKGVLYGIAAALPHMIRQRAGQIINVSSIAALRAAPVTAIYSATKEAVRVITEGLRQEVKPHNIRTTVILPGAVATDLPGGINEADIAAAMKAFYEIAISPDAFARAVAFAISQPDDVDVNEIVFRPTLQV
ncbi:SDR family oxidoreductase [Paraburkholderia susongensis]|uniref:NADP-dependent 3-hydroxy acid dehydrogenase YdfG n=1 Tax=Paraburkholderia susongensis TaxID=1515439 RepID=A0A1X7JFQ2_9BURK|nr:SDR family oxidoreductase [Paraburkholderia susongensis]SMG26829.1 NADP-dependent 3-hydroxy acid dehydrogenase YdfG [Paraburkholderia susongensis]